MKKIIRAASDNSYDRASKSLLELAELDVSARQCQRIVNRIGNERIAEQEEQIAEYRKLSLPAQKYGQLASAPLNSWSGRVAVVSADGGRTQIRDEYWGQEKPSDKKYRWWRESQCAVLQTVLSTPSLNDPNPSVPNELKDPLWIVPKIKEIHRQRGTANESDRSLSSTGESTTQAPPDTKSTEEQEDTRWSGGEPLVKTVIVTRRGYEHLGVAMATAAFQRGFNQAPAKAFLGDGLKVNWSIWSRYFSHYTPITDLMHALSYVYSASIAMHGCIEDGWKQYLVWLKLVWEGKVQAVILQMQAAVAGGGEVPEELSTAITYLSNNAQRMKYNEYRAQGLPITTSRVESTQKQVNRRVKGTEKFWADDKLEPLLQLMSDDLSETHQADGFWKRRENRFSGYRIRDSKVKVSSKNS